MHLADRFALGGVDRFPFRGVDRCAFRGADGFAYRGVDGFAFCGDAFFCLVRLAVLLFVGSVLCRMCCLLVGAALSGSRFLRGSVAVACPRLYAAFATEENIR